MIRDEASLRTLYDEPRERVVAAKVSFLTDEVKTLIRAARFVCLASEGASGLDISPRGGAPGIVHIVDDRTVAIPDMAGNNKLETLSNIVNGDGVSRCCFCSRGSTSLSGSMGRLISRTTRSSSTGCKTRAIDRLGWRS